MKLKATLITCLLFFSTQVFSLEKTTIRIAVLSFGTVNWELFTLQNQSGNDNAGFKLEIHPIANPHAGKIALQAGAVDMIVSDWIWVSRLRASGSDFTFYPYSNTVGALIVPKNSSIKTLQDLPGKKLAIAGGELDKNWLLLQALVQQKNQLALEPTVEKVYGAPPLLNQQILHQRVDALINYWHYAARLEAKGYKQLINGKEIIQQLGIEEQVPTLGYVFNRSWALANKKSVNDFLQSTQQAKNLLCENDSVWQQIIPLTKVKDIPTQNILRKRYCEGRVKQWGHKQQQAAKEIYQLLRQYSHNKLTGSSAILQPDTFWNIK